MRPRRLHLIVNPQSGGGKAPMLADRAQTVLARAGVVFERRATTCPGHARELARTLVLEPGDGLLAVGGDGTLHELVDGLLRRPDGVRVPVGLLAGGSGNALLRDLGALDPDVGLERLLAGARRPLDVLRVRWPGGVLHACTIVGWGLVADVAARAEAWRRLGPRRYDLASLAVALGARSRPARLHLPDETFDGPLALVFAGNTRHTGAGLRLTPGARPDDGLIDLLVVPALGRWRLLALLAGVRSGRHLEAAEVSLRRVRRFRLEAPGGGPLNVDGELVAGTPVEVELLPGAVELLL